MTRVSIAALTRFAAICGWLVAPAAAWGQSLKCPETGRRIQIRRVTFEGNKSFIGRELSLHVVSEPTDLSAQYLGKRSILYGGVLGAAIGVVTRKEDRWIGAVAGGGIGTFAGYVIGRASGVERCYRPGLLVGDITNIRGFYADRGFPDTRVDTAATIEGDWADITFRITEGEPVLIDSTAIVLDSAEADLLPRLNSRKGERYSPLLLQQDIDSIETRLRNSGYPEGKALRNVEVNGLRATVGLTVVRGPLARIGKVTILQSGIDQRRTVVDSSAIRDLLLFAPGDLYSERILFDSERRFYRIGSFLSTDIADDVSHVFQDSLVDVTVRVVEDLTRRFGYEPGYGTLDCLRLRTEFSDRAFRGGLNRLDLNASVSKVGRARPWPVVSDLCKLQQDEVATDISSKEINYNATVRFSRPMPLRGGLLPSLSAYTERRGGYQAYLRTTLIGGALTLSKSVTRNIFFEGSYSLEYGRTEASEPVLCFVFRACEKTVRDQLTGGNSRLAIAGARFSRDRRDRTDSASRGTFERLDLRTSQPWILSDRSLSFQKAVGDFGWYHRALGSHVIAARLRAGIIRGGQVSAGGRLPPPQERLYTGGQTTVRGFGQNELGPLIYVTDNAALDTVALNALTPDQRRATLQEQRIRIIPTGGNAMVVGNLEYRIPNIFLRSIQAILFVDVGALSTEGLVTIGEKQARWTPGVALKYFSPIGPMQFNLGYNSYDFVEGPVYLDRGIGSSGTLETLTCLSGTSGGICQPLSAKAPKSTFWKRLTFTLAFPPDF